MRRFFANFIGILGGENTTKGKKLPGHILPKVKRIKFRLSTSILKPLTLIVGTVSLED